MALVTDRTNNDHSDPQYLGETVRPQDDYPFAGRWAGYYPRIDGKKRGHSNPVRPRNGAGQNPSNIVYLKDPRRPRRARELPRRRYSDLFR